MPMHQNEFLEKIAAASRLPKEDVVRIVDALPCDYAYAYRFYCTFVRFPSLDEARQVPYAEIFRYWQKNHPSVSQQLEWIQKAKNSIEL
jgi:hypothetical protein